MMKRKLKYPQLVFAKMHRYIDNKGYCYLVRNKTKIEFGEKSDNLMGSVIMTNPGSYGLDKLEGWMNFMEGKGDAETLEGYGKPDLTMQNLICVIKEGYKKAGKDIPNGYVNIYNLSSVVCPPKDEMLRCHISVAKIIEQNGYDMNLLEHPIVHNEEKFNNMIQSSPYVIMGFVRNIFNEKVDNLIKWSSKYTSKTIYSLDKQNWQSHPRRWRTEKYLKEKAIEQLAEIV